MTTSIHLLSLWQAGCHSRVASALAQAPDGPNPLQSQCYEQLVELSEPVNTFYEQH